MTCKETIVLGEKMYKLNMCMYTCNKLMLWGENQIRFFKAHQLA